MPLREVVIDSETTGLDPGQGHRIVEIGCVELLDREPSGRTYHQYINPERDVPDEVSRIIGLSSKFLLAYPPFALIADDLIDFLGDSPLVIHNASFDLSFLNAELLRIGKPPIPRDRAIDTLLLARAKHPTGPNRLDDLALRYKVKVSKRTRKNALRDAKTLAEVYPKLIVDRGDLFDPGRVFDEKYELALQRIEAAKHKGSEKLSLADIHGLDRLPPEISELTALRSLTLGGFTESTKIENIESLSGLVNLERLHLGRTRVVNISPLASLKKLSNLNLSETRISDISSLSSLQNLSRLNLYRTRVVDLSPLSSSVKLKHLDIRKSKILSLEPLAGVLSLIPSPATSKNNDGILFSPEYIIDPIVGGMAKLRNPQRTREVLVYLRKLLGLPPVPSDRPSPDTLKDETIPRAFEQRPASFTFSIKNGKIEAEPQLASPQDSSLAKDIYEQVKNKLADARQRFARANVPQRICSSLERLSDALGASPSSLKPGLLLMRFRSLEADLVSYDTPGGQEELFPDAISMLRDLSSSLEDLMACFPKLAEIEAARLALRLQDADVTAAREQMNGIRQAAASSEVVAASAVSALDAGAPELAHTTEIIEHQTDDDVIAQAIRKRASVVAQMLLDYRNFAARVLHKMAADVGDAGVKSWDEAVKAVPKGVGKGVEKATTTLVVGGMAILVGSMAGWLSGLAVLVASFRPLAEKAKEIQQPSSEIAET